MSSPFLIAALCKSKHTFSTSGRLLQCNLLWRQSSSKHFQLAPNAAAGRKVHIIPILTSSICFCRVSVLKVLLSVFFFFSCVPSGSNKHLVARDQEQVCAATHVQTLPASTSKRTGAELPRPDETFSKAHFVVPAPTLREEPRPPSPLVIKREQDELTVTPRKNCAELPVASVHVHFKGNTDASTVMERQQTERNGKN